MRYFISLALGYGVAKGVFTKGQADAALPDLASYAILGLSFVGLVLWSYIQKRINGWITKYPQLKVINNFFPKPTIPTSDKIDQ